MNHTSKQEDYFINLEPTLASCANSLLPSTADCFGEPVCKHTLKPAIMKTDFPYLGCQSGVNDGIFILFEPEKEGAGEGWMAI